MARNPNPAHRKNILPGLQVPAGLPVELEKYLQAVKEHLQALQGILGQPKERAVTLTDLEKAGLATVVVKGGRGEIGSTAAKAGTARTAAQQGGATRVRDLSDVDTVGWVDGDLLQYRSTTDKWQRTTVESITSQLAVFDDDNQGVVPASAGGTTNFLRADGTWAEPPGTGGGGGALVYVNSEVPAGNTIADTDSETAFESTYEFQAESLAQGNVIRVKAAGVLSTDSSVAPTLTLKVYVGTDAVLTQSVTLSTALSDDGWALDAIMVVQVDGASGALEVQGIAHIEDSTFNLENSTAFTIDTTVALKISITAEWSAADEDNTVTLRELLVYLDGGDSTGAIDLSGLTFITADDETADAPDSKQLVAGNNITLDTSTPGQISISADAPADASELDYDNAASGLDATNVQAAIDEVLDTIPTDADEISYDNSVSGLTATDVQEAIDELAANGGGSGGGTAPLIPIQVAASEFGTPLEDGISVAYFRAPFAAVIEEVRASLLVPNTSGDIEIDIKVAGTTILDSPLVIDEGEKSSTTSTSPVEIKTNAAMGDDDEVTFDVEVPTGADAESLIVTLLVRPSS